MSPKNTQCGRIHAGSKGGGCSAASGDPALTGPAASPSLKQLRPDQPSPRRNAVNGGQNRVCRDRGKHAFPFIAERRENGCARRSGSNTVSHPLFHVTHFEVFTKLIHNFVHVFLPIRSRPRTISADTTPQSHMGCSSDGRDFRREQAGILTSSAQHPHASKAS